MYFLYAKYIAVSSVYHHIPTRSIILSPVLEIDYCSVKCFFSSFIYGWDTTGRQEYSVNRIIHGNKDTQSQGIKGICKQLNKNKTLTAAWPIAGLFCTCKHSR